MNLSSKACDWTLLGMEIENCFLNHSKPNTWAHQRRIRMINIKGQKFMRYMPSKCKAKPFQANTKRSWSRFKPSMCKPEPFHHNQGSSTPSLRHPKWTKKKQVAQLCLTPHLVATSWLSLKFVCLFHISMFVWILKIHVAFDVVCSCIYLKKKFKKKKNSRFPNFSQKKRKIFK